MESSGGWRTIGSHIESEEDDQSEWLKVDWWEGALGPEGDESESDAETQADIATRFPHKNELAAATKSNEARRAQLREVANHMLEVKKNNTALGREDKKEFKRDEEWDRWKTQMGKWTPSMLYDMLCAMSSVRSHELHEFLMAFTREVPAEVLDKLSEEGDYAQASQELQYIKEIVSRDGYTFYPWQRPSWIWVRIFKPFYVSDKLSSLDPSWMNLCIDDMAKIMSRNFAFPESRFSWDYVRQGVLRFFGGSNHAISKVQLFYCPAYRVFHTRPMQQAKLLRALADSDDKVGVFATPIGSALLADAWKLECFWYVFDLLCEVAMICLLFKFSHDYRRSTVPGRIQIMLLVFLSLKNLFQTLEVIIVHLCKDDSILSFTDLLVSFEGLFIITDMYSCYVLLVIVGCNRFSAMLVGNFAEGWEHVEPNAESNLLHHTNHIAFMILFRWMHLALNILGFRAIGQNVLPALYAMAKAESRWFLFAMFFMVFGSFHAYYAFPIPQNIGEWTGPLLQSQGFNKVLDTFMKVYRLNVMGDFDLLELEGLDESVQGNMTIHGNMIEMDQVAIDEPDIDPSRNVFQGIRIFFIVLSMLVNVSFLNVYIGLLSMLYEEAHAQKIQLHHHFIAGRAHIYLMRRVAWEWLSGRRPDPEADGNNPYNPVWMVFEEGSWLDAVEEKENAESKMDEMIQNIAEMRAEMREFMNQGRLPSNSRQMASPCS